MTEEFHLSLAPSNRELFPPLDTTFGRINVILGANGTGKSKLIDRLKRTGRAFGDRSVIYVEGGRVVTPPKSVALSRGNINRFNDYTQALQKYETEKRDHQLSDRVTTLFTLLDQRGRLDKIRHSNAVTEWMESGQDGEIPKRDTPPIERLFSLFSELFPNIELTIDDDSREISCHRNGRTYQPQDLSDGERQVLALLADIAVRPDEPNLVLVDEPELNLNEALACQLWDLIESERPDSVFIYATHSLSLAMRESVTHVVVLRGLNEEPLEVGGVSEIAPKDREPFLGAIPSIVAAPAALIVEGSDESVDNLFYQWLLGRPEVEVVGVGDSKTVEAAASKAGVWNRLGADTALHGVIDRDYRGSDDLTEERNCSVLDWHECESYLCYPQLVVDLTDQLGLRKGTSNVGEVRDIIIGTLREQVIPIIARRLAHMFRANSSLSIQRRAINAIDDVEQLTARTIREAEKEHKRVKEKFSEVDIKIAIQRQKIKIDKIIADRDIPGALRILPGKELLESRIIGIAGCTAPTDYVRGVSAHLNPVDYEPTAILKRKLEAEL